MSNLWTEEELFILEKNSLLPASKIAELIPQRTEKAIKSKRKSMGYKINNNNNWTKEEILLLYDTSKSASELNIPGRSIYAIQQKRRNLGISYSEVWTEEEKDLIKSDRTLDTIPGRSKEAVKLMRSKLNIPRLTTCKTCGKVIEKNNGYDTCSDCKKSDSYYNSTPAHKYSQYKNGAKKRNIPFDLTYEEFYTFWNKPCQYCGGEIKTVGIDRVDNTKGYILENCVPCCKTCNVMKLNHTTEFWISHIQKILEHTNETT